MCLELSWYMYILLRLSFPSSALVTEYSGNIYGGRCVVEHCKCVGSFSISLFA